MKRFLTITLAFIAGLISDAIIWIIKKLKTLNQPKQ